jgi:predicted dithiol-disulfide oxidoreductase (DUF899 family)
MDTTDLRKVNRISEHPIVLLEEWLPLRTELLKKEKELTRVRDRPNAERRALPWVRVEKNYVFDAPGGKVSLTDLFAGRSQLVIYLMFGPDWEVGCPSCSVLMDHVDGAIVHLNARDVPMVMVSRAPLARIEVFKKRMGWRFGCRPTAAISRPTFGCRSPRNRPRTAASFTTLTRFRLTGRNVMDSACSIKRQREVQA